MLNSSVHRPLLERSLFVLCIVLLLYVVSLNMTVSNANTSLRSDEHPIFLCSHRGAAIATSTHPLETSNARIMVWQRGLQRNEQSKRIQCLDVDIFLSKDSIPIIGHLDQVIQCIGDATLSLDAEELLGRHSSLLGQHPSCDIALITLSELTELLQLAPTIQWVTVEPKGRLNTDLRSMEALADAINTSGFASQRSLHLIVDRLSMALHLRQYSSTLRMAMSVRDRGAGLEDAASSVLCESSAQFEQISRLVGVYSVVMPSVKALEVCGTATHSKRSRLHQQQVLPHQSLLDDVSDGHMRCSHSAWEQIVRARGAIAGLAQCTSVGIFAWVCDTPADWAAAHAAGVTACITNLPNS